MSAVLQCTMAAAHAVKCHGPTDASSQWHEAVMAELKRLLSAAQECSSLAISIQTGEYCKYRFYPSHCCLATSAGMAFDDHLLCVWKTDSPTSMFV